MICGDTGCECADMQEQLLGNYQAISSFPNDQTCCVGAENVESRPKQHQLKVS